MRRFSLDKPFVHISIPLDDAGQKSGCDNQDVEAQVILSEQEIYQRLRLEWVSLTSRTELRVHQQSLVCVIPFLETDISVLCRIFDSMIEFTRSYREIRAVGTKAAYSVAKVAQSRSLMRQIAQYLLQDIAHQSKIYSGNQVDHYLCQDCLTTPAPFIIGSGAKKTTLYGCCTCHYSHRLLKGIPTALLDYHNSDLLKHQESVIKINELKQDTLFDFSRVEIVAASDQEVERFVMKIGNDTDPIRRKKYGTIPVFVSEKCALSNNTLRLLQRHLGEVKVA